MARTRSEVKAARLSNTDGRKTSGIHNFISPVSDLSYDPSKNVHAAKRLAIINFIIHSSLW